MRAHIQNLWRTALSMQRRFANMKNVNRKIDYELGRFIWSIIDKSEYTQEEMAEQLGVSREAVNKYCSGKIKPKQRTLLRIVKLTNVQAKDIPF